MRAHDRRRSWMHVLPCRVDHGGPEHFNREYLYIIYIRCCDIIANSSRVLSERMIPCSTYVMGASNNRRNALRRLEEIQLYEQRVARFSRD